MPLPGMRHCPPGTRPHELRALRRTETGAGQGTERPAEGRGKIPARPGQSPGSRTAALPQEDGGPGRNQCLQALRQASAGTRPEKLPRMRRETPRGGQGEIPCRQEDGKALRRTPGQVAPPVRPDPQRAQTPGMGRSWKMFALRQKQACRRRVHVHPLQDQAPGARQGQIRREKGHGFMCSLWSRPGLRRHHHLPFLQRHGSRQRKGRTAERRVPEKVLAEKAGVGLHRLRLAQSRSIEVPELRRAIVRQILPLPRDARLGTGVHRGGPGHRGRARALRQPGRRGRRRRVSQAPAGAFRSRRREPSAGGIGGMVMTSPSAPRPAGGPQAVRTVGPGPAMVTSVTAGPRPPAPLPACRWRSGIRRPAMVRQGRRVKCAPRAYMARGPAHLHGGRDARPHCTHRLRAWKTPRQGDMGGFRPLERRGRAIRRGPGRIGNWEQGNGPAGTMRRGGIRADLQPGGWRQPRNPAREAMRAPW